MFYPKINSIYKRFSGYDANNNNKHYYKQGPGSFIEGEYACDEFASIKNWLVVEKIDGINTRIHISPDGDFEIKGRTDKTNILNSIRQAINPMKESLIKYFKQTEYFQYSDVWLFGEGYGGNIQKSGASYKNNVDFILFDVNINGIWLDRNEIEKIGSDLKINIAPIIGFMTTYEVIDYVKSMPKSICSSSDTYVMEGVICRPNPLLLFRDGTPLLMKIKCKDF